MDGLQKIFFAMSDKNGKLAAEKRTVNIKLGDEDNDLPVDKLPEKKIGI